MNLKQFKKLNVGIVGCGYWATNIIKSLEEENFNNLYVYDSDKKKLKTIKSKFSYLNLCSSLESLLANRLDCVMLVTPPSTHFGLAKKILAENINLFIEKPVTLNSKHLKDLIKLSKKNKTILMSGYIYIYSVYINYIRKILKKNTLGKLKYIYFERSNLGPIRNDTSCLWDLASHDISTALFLLNRKPKISFVKVYNFLKKKLFDISSLGLDFKNVRLK